MSESKRRFWSSIPGMVTGAAGVLTAIVGLITVLIQLDVIGKDSDDGTDTTRPGSSATQPGATTAPRAGAGGATPTFSVSPAALTLDTLLKKEGEVTVRNSGSVPLTVEAEVTGRNTGEFDVETRDCTSAAVSRGAECKMTVTYTPSAAGQHSARLQVTVDGAASPADVQLSGSRPV